MTPHTMQEPPTHIQGQGESIREKVREIVRGGNVRRIIIKNDAGQTIMELPVTVGAVGATLAPMLAAVGAVAALMAKCTIEVELQPE